MINLVTKAERYLELVKKSPNLSLDEIDEYNNLVLHYLPEIVERFLEIHQSLYSK